MKTPDTNVSTSTSPAKEANRNARMSYALSFFISVFAAVLVPVVPLLAFNMGASQFELGLIGAAIPVTYVPLALMSGPLSNRIGRKKLIVLSCLVYSLACATYALSSTPQHLMVGRLLEGVSTAMLWPAVEALLADSTDIGGSKLVSNFGVLWSSGSLLGGLLSSLALAVGSYGVVFIPCAGFSLLMGAASVFGLSEKKTTTAVTNVKDGPPVPARSMLTTWGVAMIYAVCQGMIFSLYPPYAEIAGIPGALIGLAIALGLAGRTITFYLYRFLKVKFKTLALVGAILASVFTLQLAFTTEPFMVLTAGFLFGVGMGLCYSAAIRSTLDVDSASRSRYAGLFEGSIGLGYFLGPAIGGAAAELYLPAPYVISSAAALVFAIIIVMGREK